MREADSTGAGDRWEDPRDASGGASDASDPDMNEDNAIAARKGTAYEVIHALEAALSGLDRATAAQRKLARPGHAPETAPEAADAADAAHHLEAAGRHLRAVMRIADWHYDRLRGELGKAGDHS